MSDFTFEKEEHINYIIKNFNFQRVHDTMKHLKWTWYTSPTDSPSIQHLKKEAKRLLNEVYNSNSTSIATGGFKASKYDDHLELEFVISDWSSDSINYGTHYEKIKKLKTRKRKLKTIEKLNEDESN